MSAAFFRQLAQQCRELLARAATEGAKEQLRLWAAEFDAEASSAAELEPGEVDSPGIEGTRA
ncbi:MAG TPA: hypothetical protein VJR70_11875 [Stellaceae bacterium]|nr:hypothetical protein [Stellaceae bacterium]